MKVESDHLKIGTSVENPPFHATICYLHRMKDLKQLNDEVFCLAFELATLGQASLQGKLERWLPGYTDVVTDFDHQQRYEWACNFTKNKTILDIASGSGKGSHLLSTIGEAKHVLGCDIEEDAVKYSSIKYQNSNLSYAVENATTLKRGTLFDVIISFETIEHIKETDRYLNSIHNHLSDDGIFIVSTPISKNPVDFHPKNPFHVIEWGFEAFQNVLAAKFTIDNIYVQLHAPKPYTLVERMAHKMFPKRSNYQDTRIEEFNHQVKLQRLGKQVEGYQIVICRKNTVLAG